MCSWIDCTLDVLATNPEEINNIAKALLVPSKEFLVRVIQTENEISDMAKALLETSQEFLVPGTETQSTDDEEIEGLRELVAFKAVKNLGYVDESVNKGRRFENSLKSPFRPYIHALLCQISETFPHAIFLVEYCDMQWSWSSKEVLRNGVVERSVFDDRQQAQAMDWILLNIFAPFRAEYQTEQPFGSLWNQWVYDLVAAADALKKDITATCSGSSAS